MSYFWNFGDGQTSTLQNPSHAYNSFGPFNVCLTISNQLGCNDTYCDTITLGNSSGCNASYNVYPDSTNLLTYYFANTSTGVSSTNTYYWSFGDGTTSALTNPSHTYSNYGSYLVCLHVSDALGTILCTYCDSLEVDTSSTQNCHAYFQYTVSGNTVSLNGNSNIQSATYIWSLNNTIISNSQNAVYTFTGPGAYTVCLTVTDNNACTDTYCQTIVIGSTICNLYVSANSITNESVSGADDGAISINVIGGILPYSFVWSTGATTQNISGLSQGYYNVLVTDSIGCHTYACFQVLNDADSLNWSYPDSLLINAIDTCFDFIVGSASIYSFTFVSNNTISITWIVYDTQGVLHDFITVNYTFSSNGFYLAQLSFDCGKSTYNFYDQIHIINQAIGINSTNASNQNISLFPNPVTDILNVLIDIKESSAITINILNVTSQLVYSEKLTYELGQKSITLNTSSLSKGLYFVQVNYNGQTLMGKFVK